MATFSIIHTCGHRATIHLNGPLDEQECKVDEVEQGACRFCLAEMYYRKVYAASSGLGPIEIVGLPQDVKDAERIRSSLLQSGILGLPTIVDDLKRDAESLDRRKFATRPDEEIIRKALDVISEMLAQNRAEWWIMNEDTLRSSWSKSLVERFTKLESLPCVRRRLSTQIGPQRQ